MIADMKEVGSEEARKHYRELQNQAEYGGEHIAIQRYGKTSVVWVPVEWYERAKAALEREEQES